MRAVDVKTLENKLGEYIRAASHGEIVLVTDRDRVVAEIRPPQLDRAEQVGDALLADVVRQGWLRPPPRSSAALPVRRPVAPLAAVLRELENDRRDR